MSKRSDKKKAKLEVKRETLRKMEIKPEDLKQAVGGRYTDTDPPGTYPSRMC